MMMSLMQSNPQLLASLGKGYRMMTIELRNIERLKELEVSLYRCVIYSNVLDNHLFLSLQLTPPPFPLM